MNFAQYTMKLISLSQHQKYLMMRAITTNTSMLDHVCELAI